MCRDIKTLIYCSHEREVDMENKSKIWALILAHVGGVIALSTLLAAALPFLYARGLVYFGFGWIKGGAFAVGLAIAAFGLVKLFKKPAKK